MKLIESFPAIERMACPACGSRKLNALCFNEMTQSLDNGNWQDPTLGYPDNNYLQRINCTDCGEILLDRSSDAKKALMGVAAGLQVRFYHPVTADVVYELAKEIASDWTDIELFLTTPEEQDELYGVPLVVGIRGIDKDTGEPLRSDNQMIDDLLDACVGHTSKIYAEKNASIDAYAGYPLADDAVRFRTRGEYAIPNDPSVTLFVFPIKLD